MFWFTFAIACAVIASLAAARLLDDRSLLIGGVLCTCISLVFATFYFAWSLEEQRHQLKSLRMHTKKLNATSESLGRYVFNDVTERIFSKMNSNEKLGERMREGNVEVKKGIGAIFQNISLKSESILDVILSHNFFIESGSTLAYLGLDMNDHMTLQKSSKVVDVFTNNILIYLILLYQRRCNVTLYPGVPDDKFGAAYGRGNVDYDEMQRYLGAETDDVSNESIKRPGTRIHPTGGVELIIMTSSRLHLQEGLHVGSKENAKYKEFLLAYGVEQKCPIVLIIDSSKLEPKSLPIPDSCFRVDLKRGGAGGFSDLLDYIAQGHLFLCVAYRKSDHAFERQALQQEASGRVMHKRLTGGELEMEVFFSMQPTPPASSRPVWELLYSRFATGVN